MSFRTWRFRRVLGIAFLWMLLLLVASIGRAAVGARLAASIRPDERQHLDLDVRKSGVIPFGKSHIDPVSAWLTPTDAPVVERRR